MAEFFSAAHGSPIAEVLEKMLADLGSQRRSMAPAASPFGWLGGTVQDLQLLRFRLRRCNEIPGSENMVLSYNPKTGEEVSCARACSVDRGYYQWTCNQTTGRWVASSDCTVPSSVTERAAYARVAWAQVGVYSPWEDEISLLLAVPESRWRSQIVSSARIQVQVEEMYGACVGRSPSEEEVEEAGALLLGELQDDNTYVSMNLAQLWDWLLANVCEPGSPETFCAPYCAGTSMDCGNDGCNAPCGYGDCPPDSECMNGTCDRSCCEPIQAECGDDGCGNYLGDCLPGSVCVDGRCSACQPIQAECGDDGCGSYLGDCPPGDVCVDGRCSACQPIQAECGDDGCGRYLDCPPGDVCADGRCSACQPIQVECGDDGCGNDRGDCAPGNVCVDGRCTAV